MVSSRSSQSLGCGEQPGSRGTARPVYRACGLQLPPWASLQRPALDPHLIPVLERKALPLPGPGVPGSMGEPGCFQCAVLSESKGTPFDET